MARSWTLASLGLAAFAVLVWLAGPLLVLGGQAPLASPQARLLVVGIFTLQYLAQKLWNFQKARRNNQLVVAELKPAREPGLPAEAALLRERFATALAELRRLRFGARGAWRFWRSYVYELPWYMIIGSPGAGKTTALLNSGLSFPLAGKLGRGPVGGVGGTRNCDWWFTDRAVLIDTAGRYTTHESDRVADRQGWEAFLQLLLRVRPRRPLNGVLVAISVGDLLEFDAEQLAEHARILRARLEELQAALRVRLPVYVLVTKCDLLPGFVDWFGTLARQDRDQAWGVAFDLRTASSMGAAADFVLPFERLVNQLADGLLERLRAERDPQRRGRIFALPGQLRALSEPLADLVRGAFGSSGASSSNPATFLRGVYLTSGTQHGTPIDRMLSAFGRELGLERQILPPNQSTGKSFFLAGLLNDVVLAEAALSGRTPRGLLWQRRMLLLSILLVQLSALAVAGWWITGYLRTVHSFAQLDDEVSKAHSVIDAIPASPDPDPRSLLPALNSLHALVPTLVRANPAELIDVGARSRQKLATAAQEAYNRMLLGPFQGRIAQAIDTTMRIGADANVQYEALKAYVMLSDAEHFDGTGLKTFVMSYWDAALAPPLRSIERNVLADHVDALLSAGAVGSGIRLEPVLVDSVRRRLSSQSGAQRIALRLTVLLNAHPYADFTIASLGPAAALFVGTDGRSAPQAVPGNYTIEAYRGLVTIEVPALASQLAYETKWVLGVPATSAEADAAEAMASYRASYALSWSQLIDDLHLKATSSNQEAVRQAQALGDPDGPLPVLLDAIASQTPLRLPNGTDGPIASADPSADRFLALAKLVARGTNDGSALAATMQHFRELQALRTPVASGNAPVATTASVADRLARIIADARREPEPVRSMLLTLAVPPPGSGPPQESHLSAASLSRQIAARLGLACIQLVAGHFPFDRRAARDASFEDFSRLFAPKGAFDEVFGRLLATRVDVSSETWRALAGAGPDPQDLERFRAAARIRDVFFAHGGTQPGFQLTLKPLDMDESIDRFQLEIDGQTVRYAHGPLVPTIVKWPGPHPGSGARIELTPAGTDTPAQYSGPWALFRLLDHAAIREAGSPGRLQVVFDVGGRRASFEVQTDNGANPFRLRELEHFDCPIAGQ